MDVLTITTKIPFSTKEVEKRHLDPEAVFRWLIDNDEVFASELLPAQNSQRMIRFKTYSLWIPFKSDMKVYFDPQKLFRVKQEKGLFEKFEYCVACEKSSDYTVITDEIHYRLKHSWFFPKFRQKRLSKVLKKIIHDKNQIIHAELRLLKKYANEPSKKILIFGSHGFIGRPLDLLLSSLGHDVYRAVRSKKQLIHRKNILFNEESGESNRDQFENFDVFINLAGANISEKRWSDKQKSVLYQSRVQYTQKLSKMILSLSNPPKTFINASAVGYYGSQVAFADEDSAKGKGFLSDLAHDWEKAASLVTHRNCRLVVLRFGVVLGPGGGLLQVFRNLAKWHLLAPLGKGEQRVAWVSRRDVINAIYHFICTKSAGTFNLVAADHPSQKTLSEFVKKSLGMRISRFFPPPVPKFLIDLIFGTEMSDELFFASQVISNQKIQDAGFSFDYPTLDKFLTD